MMKYAPNSWQGRAFFWQRNPSAGYAMVLLPFLGALAWGLDSLPSTPFELLDVELVFATYLVAHGFFFSGSERRHERNIRTIARSTVIGFLLAGFLAQTFLLAVPNLAFGHWLVITSLAGFVGAGLGGYHGTYFRWLGLRMAIKGAICAGVLVLILVIIWEGKNLVGPSPGLAKAAIGAFLGVLLGLLYVKIVLQLFPPTAQGSE